MNEERRRESVQTNKTEGWKDHEKEEKEGKEKCQIISMIFALRLTGKTPRTT